MSHQWHQRQARNHATNAADSDRATARCIGAAVFGDGGGGVQIGGDDNSGAVSTVFATSASLNSCRDATDALSPIYTVDVILPNNSSGSSTSTAAAAAATTRNIDRIDAADRQHLMGKLGSVMERVDEVHIEKSSVPRLSGGRGGERSGRIL